MQEDKFSAVAWGCPGVDFEEMGTCVAHARNRTRVGVARLALREKKAFFWRTVVLSKHETRRTH